MHRTNALYASDSPLQILYTALATLNAIRLTEHELTVNIFFMLGHSACLLVSVDFSLN